MSFPELLDAARKLTSVEKIRLMHELLDEFAAPISTAILSQLPQGVDIVSPIPAPEAAAALTALLGKGGTS